MVRACCSLGEARPPGSKSVARLGVRARLVEHAGRHLPPKAGPCLVAWRIHYTHTLTLNHRLKEGIKSELPVLARQALAAPLSRPYLLSNLCKAPTGVPVKWEAKEHLGVRVGLARVASVELLRV